MMNSESTTEWINRNIKSENGGFSQSNIQYIPKVRRGKKGKKRRSKKKKKRPKPIVISRLIPQKTNEITSPKPDNPLEVIFVCADVVGVIVSFLPVSFLKKVIPKCGHWFYNIIRERYPWTLRFDSDKMTIRDNRNFSQLLSRYPNVYKLKLGFSTGTGYERREMHTMSKKHFGSMWCHSLRELTLSKISTQNHGLFKHFPKFRKLESLTIHYDQRKSVYDKNKSVRAVAHPEICGTFRKLSVYNAKVSSFGKFRGCSRLESLVLSHCVLDFEEEEEDELQCGKSVKIESLSHLGVFRSRLPVSHDFLPYACVCFPLLEVLKVTAGSLKCKEYLPFKMDQLKEIDVKVSQWTTTDHEGSNSLPESAEDFFLDAINFKVPGLRKINICGRILEFKGDNDRSVVECSSDCLKMVLDGESLALKDDIFKAKGLSVEYKDNNEEIKFGSFRSLERLQMIVTKTNNDVETTVMAVPKSEVALREILAQCCTLKELSFIVGSSPDNPNNRHVLSIGGTGCGMKIGVTKLTSVALCGFHNSFDAVQKLLNMNQYLVNVDLARFSHNNNKKEVCLCLKLPYLKDLQLHKVDIARLSLPSPQNCVTNVRVTDCKKFAGFAIKNPRFLKLVEVIEDEENSKEFLFRYEFIKQIERSQGKRACQCRLVHSRIISEGFRFGRRFMHFRKSQKDDTKDLEAAAHYKHLRSVLSYGKKHTPFIDFNYES